MSNLAEHQRAMLDLIKRRPVPPGDPYLDALAGSKELDLLREITVFWRTIAVSHGCRWTAQLLKRLGRLDEAVTDFTVGENVSPYSERAAGQFLARMSLDADPLVSAMAKFERALWRVESGSTTSFVVEWDRNPDQVFAALGSGGALPGAEPNGRYALHLSQAIEGLMRCEWIGDDDVPA